MLDMATFRHKDLNLCHKETHMIGLISLLTVGNRAGTTLELAVVSTLGSPSQPSQFTRRKSDQKQKGVCKDLGCDVTRRVLFSNSAQSGCHRYRISCTVAARWLHGFLQLRSPWFLLTTKEVGTCKASPIKTG